MISINGKVLSNTEVISLLEKETGGGKMKGDIEFCLLDNYCSSIKTLNDQGEAKYVRKFQATYGVSNQYDRRNFAEGGTETVIYFTTTINDKVNGQPRYLTNDMNKIVFYHGHLTVRPGQEDLLLWLRLNERCQTNKYWEHADARGNQKYTPQGAFNYKEIIPEKVSELAYNDYYEGLKAQAAVVNEDRISKDMALKMAISYGMVDAKFAGEKAIRLFLAQKAKANPEQFMADLNSAAFELRAQVNSCFLYGILAWDVPYIRWANKKAADGDTRICTVPVGRDHVDFMVGWLRETDKSGVLNELRVLLEKEQLKEVGIQVEVPQEQRSEFLKMLGVSSLEEAAAIIKKSKGSETAKVAPADIADVINRLNDFDADALAKMDDKTLKAIGKHLEIRSWHVLSAPKLVEKIIEKSRATVIA